MSHKDLLQKSSMTKFKGELYKFLVLIFNRSNIFKLIFGLYSMYSLENKSRSAASQALHKATKRGRVLKIGNLYKLNSNYIAPTKVIHASGFILTGVFEKPHFFLLE